MTLFIRTPNKGIPIGDTLASLVSGSSSLSDETLKPWPHLHMTLAFSGMFQRVVHFYSKAALYNVGVVRPPASGI